MEVYYFISGILITVVAILLYQYRFMLVTIKDNQQNAEAMKDAHDATNQNVSSILEKLADDRYESAVMAGSKADALAVKVIENDKSINSLASNITNHRKETKDSFEGVRITIDNIFKTTTDNRQY